MLEMVRRSGGELLVVGEGRCDCGGIIRHNNGGNYHPGCKVYWTGEHMWREDFAVWWSNTREAFPGDEEWRCRECGMWGRQDDRHSHFKAEEMEEMERRIVEYVGKGGTVYLEVRRNGKLVAHFPIE
jgi:hypothetical protein